MASLAALHSRSINVNQVDTPVAQLIYAADSSNPLIQDHKLLVGQFVDVFIDMRPASGTHEQPVADMRSATSHYER